MAKITKEQLFDGFPTDWVTIGAVAKLFNIQYPVAKRLTLELADERKVDTLSFAARTKYRKAVEPQMCMAQAISA
jgi:hypothetical protein